MSESALRPKYAPKVPVGWIVRLYKADALGIRDEELVDQVGWRLHARCRDVLMISDSKVRCPGCRTVFPVPWVGQAEERASTCPVCGWSISAGAFHASFRHQDLLGGNASEAFEAFADAYPEANGYVERMLLIDRLVHALHRSGNFAARNLLEGRPREVLAILDALAGAAGGSQATAQSGGARHSGDMEAHGV